MSQCLKRCLKLLLLFKNSWICNKPNFSYLFSKKLLWNKVVDDSFKSFSVRYCKNCKFASMSNPLPKFREIAKRYIRWYYSLVSQFFHTLFLSSYRKRMDDFNTNFHLDQPGGPPPPLVAPHGGPGGGMDDGSSQMPSQRQVQVIHCQINIIFWHF